MSPDIIYPNSPKRSESRRARKLVLLARDAGVPESRIDEPYDRLVRTIQQSQGNEPCFMTDQRFVCRNFDCQWRAECVRLVASWQR